MTDVNDHIRDTTGPVKRRRNWIEWPVALFVALCAGSAAMVLLRGPELLSWACRAWDAGP